MILLIDNYDSFTYNLYQVVSELGFFCRVVRNDRLSLGQIRKWRPKKIIISPGPGRPENAGITVKAIRHFGGKTPIFGVCLGHQAIGYAFGGKVVPAPALMHGKLSAVRHAGQGVFRGIKNPFQATRYHSLVVDPKTLPRCLEVTARAEGGVIMGLRHLGIEAEGVQFHPESILTSEGKKILANFLRRNA